MAQEPVKNAMNVATTSFKLTIERHLFQDPYRVWGYIPYLLYNKVTLFEGFWDILRNFFTPGPVFSLLRGAKAAAHPCKNSFFVGKV